MKTRSDDDMIASLRKTSLGLVLMGTAIGRTNRAIILAKKDKKQQIYQVGDVVAGARIARILWRKVIFDIDGREEILDMSEAEKYRTQLVIPSVAAASTAVQGSNGAVAAAASPRQVVDQLLPERIRIVLPSEKSAASDE